MSALLVTRDTVNALINEIAEWGARTAETGGFLLAPEDRPDRMSILALAGHAGITRRPRLFTVSGTAIDQLFTWAGEREMRIRAQVHSHAHGAFLSQTDLDHGFDVNGFITAVIPQFTAPPAQPGDWGWWQWAAGGWQRRRAPDAVAGKVQLLHFDEEGIRAA